MVDYPLFRLQHLAKGFLPRFSDMIKGGDSYYVKLSFEDEEKKRREE